MPENNIIRDTIGGMIPDISVSGAGTLILWFLGVIFFIVIIGIGTYFLVLRLRYNKNIVLYRKVGGRIQKIGTYKGMFERIGSAGDYWCRLRNPKKILPKPRIEIDKNIYWFYEREDGEWINFEFHDIDDQMKKANVRYDDEDMRLQRLGIQRNLEQRFQKVTFWEKYGGMIMSLIFVLVTAIMYIVLFKTMGDSWTQAGQMAESVRDMANQVQQLSQRIGGGIQPVS
jgi:hypothetical protein